MLRRIGYGLGLLFVLACAAAYPLTWGRAVEFSCATGDGRVFAGVSGGVGWMGFTHWTDKRFSFSFPAGMHVETNRREPKVEDLYAFGFYRDQPEIGRGGFVHAPLWLPMILVGGLMSWRWRRRTRRGTGFPMHSETTTVPPDRPD